MIKNSKYILKVETFNKKRYFVARNPKGQFLARKKYAKSGLNKLSATRIFKKNNTFSKNRVKIKQKLTNFYINSNLTNSSFKNYKKKPPLSPPKTKNRMYQISGTYKKINVFANSNVDTSKSSSELKAEAWENFLERISQINNSMVYDADEGIKVIENQKVSNIKEGWVYYTPIKNKK